MAKYLEVKVMKNLTTITISIFLCFYMASCAGWKYNLSSEKEPKGFRGIKWGTDIKVLPDMVFDNRSAVKTFYIRKNEKLKIGVMDVEEITYGFYKGKFCSVHISYKTHFRYHMYNILQAAYGKPKREDFAGLPSYLWKNERVVISLFIIDQSEVEFVQYSYEPIHNQMHKDTKRIEQKMWDEGIKELE